MNGANVMSVDDSSSLKWAFDYPVQSSGWLTRTAAVRVKGRMPLPHWAQGTLARLEQLAALSTVDPRSSRSMSLDDVVHALEFLFRVMQDDTPAPWIGRLNSGGVQLTWRSGNVEVEAVFDRARDERAVIVVVGDSEWDAPADEADSLFATVVERLAHPDLEHTA